MDLPPPTAVRGLAQTGSNHQSHCESPISSYNSWMQMKLALFEMKYELFIVHLISDKRENSHLDKDMIIYYQIYIKIKFN